MKRSSISPLKLVLVLVLIVLFLLGAKRWLDHNTIVISPKNTSQQENVVVQFPTAQYKTTWNETTKILRIFFEDKLLQAFEVPHKPLAIWLKPDTRTTVIAASEDDMITGNQVLYVRKDGLLRELSHLVDGYENNTPYSRSFYNMGDQTVSALDDVYITPREELIITREYQTRGFIPRVFFINIASLSSYRNVWDHGNVYWSPNGKCYLYWGEASDSSYSFGNEFGYFQLPTDFVSYETLDNTHDRRDINVIWENQERCSGYVMMIADEEGHEGAPSYNDKKYVYHFGVNVPRMLQEVPVLPKNATSFLPSMKSDQKLIMVTYTK